MKQWKVAQIGCGAMAAVHATQVSELPEAELALAVDLDAEKAKNFADRFKFARSCSRWEDVLDDKTIDIAIVATYAETHHQICKALLEAGKHVICEKPYSMDLAEIREIIEVVKRTGKKLRVSFVLRFSPPMSIVKDLLDKGEIGPKPWFYRMTMAQAPSLADVDRGWSYLANLISNAGSATADCGIHYVDLFRWWSGEEVTHVSSIGITTEDNPRPAGHNLGLLTMNLSGGSVGWVEDNWARVARPWQEMELIGPDGRIYFQFCNFRPSHLQREGHCIELFSKKNYRTQIVPVPLNTGKQTGRQFQRLIQHIENDEDVSEHLNDVYRCTEVVLAANTAAREKRTIELPLRV